MIRKINDLIDNKGFSNDFTIIEGVKENIDSIKKREKKETIIILETEGEFTIFKELKEYSVFIADKIELGDKFDCKTTVL